MVLVVEFSEKEVAELETVFDTDSDDAVDPEITLLVDAK